MLAIWYQCGCAGVSSRAPSPQAQEPDRFSADLQPKKPTQRVKSAHNDLVGRESRFQGLLRPFFLEELS